MLSTLARQRGRTLRPRDTQRARVYRFDAAVRAAGHGGDRLELPAAQALVAQVWAQWGCSGQPPQVSDGRGRRRAVAKGDWAIALPRAHRLRYVVLHEVAHCICWRMYGNTVAGHGPEFVTIYRGLLRAYLGLSDLALATALKLCRVRCY